MNRLPLPLLAATLLAMAACTAEGADAGDPVPTTAASLDASPATTEAPPAPPSTDAPATTAFRTVAEVLAEIAAPGVDFDAETPNDAEAAFVAVMQSMTPDRTRTQPILNNAENTCYDLAVEGAPPVARIAARFEVDEAVASSIVAALQATVCPGVGAR